MTTTTTETKNMEPTKQLAVRLPVSLVERLETHAARLRKRTPGANLTRADAVRVLLIDALDYAEAQERDGKTTTK